MRRYLLLSLPLLAGGCANNQALRAEIASLRSDVGNLETAIAEQTPGPSGRVEDLHSRVAYRPVIAWADNFSARPPAERTIRFQQIRRHGQLAKDDWDCGIFGDGGWLVELNSGDASRGYVLIERLGLVPDANGITAQVPLAAKLETRLHWHFDPCIGGGFGGNVFVDTGVERVGAVARVSVGAIANGKLPYAIDVTAPPEINVTARVHLGPIGTLGIPFKMKNIARHISDGEIGLLFASEGELGQLPGGQTARYRLATTKPSVILDAQSIQVSSSIEAHVDPVQTAYSPEVFSDNGPDHSRK